MFRTVWTLRVAAGQIPNPIPGAVPATVAADRRQRSRDLALTQRRFAVRRSNEARQEDYACPAKAGSAYHGAHAGPSFGRSLV